MAQDEIREEHDRLKALIEPLEDKRDFWEHALQDDGPYLRELLEDFQSEEEGMKERLVDIKKADLESVQADIKARRAIVTRVFAQSDSGDVNAAREELSRFETENALLLGIEVPSEATLGEVPNAADAHL